MVSSIQAELERQAAIDKTKVKGPVAEIASEYVFSTSDRLLGLVLKLDFAESHFATCDPWKRRCGGVPRGSFVLFKVDPSAVGVEGMEFCSRLILARVKDSAPTPVDANVQQTLFQMHKLQASPDPITQKDFQWGALSASIIGTYFDEIDGATVRIGFGNDVDTFLSPFSYAVYMPTEEHLAILINSFVRTSKPVEIGRLRYTETPSPEKSKIVPIFIDPKDLVGEPNAAQRLANFGKTRYGKSNSSKIISTAVFESGLNVAQVFFDPSGEYTYINDQDGTSLFALNHKRAVRYSLSPKKREDEQKLALEVPRALKVNFYEFPSVGHGLIQALWSTENDTTPGYLRPILDWSPVDPGDAPKKSDVSEFNHYWRTMGMWYALLRKAGFEVPQSTVAPITFQKHVKVDLKTVTGVALEKGEFCETGQHISVLPAIYSRVSELHRTHPGEKDWFAASKDGSSYFNDTELKLLEVLENKNSWTGHNYIRPFNKYHSPLGSSVFKEISDHIRDGRSVFIDLSQGNEAVRRNMVDRICRDVFNTQNRDFNSENGVGDRFVMLHFEEAHRLFRADDKDLNSIYNLLAKEGAKLNIAMVYSTQSMTTISPDLLKNTDNFLIAHLDDDRETREVARKYAFRDVADDVQRIQSKGFVRMLTRSHRFALPVQIHKFKAPDQH
jgi:DNA helicase HerA-like ATPase